MKLSDITALPRASFSEMEEIEAYAGSVSIPRLTPISNTYAQPSYIISVVRRHGYGGYQAKAGDIVCEGASPQEALGALVMAISNFELGSPFTIQVNV